MPLKPWYKVIYPRDDLREGQPLDASEFAVHLDQVRDGRARADYQNPGRFFERTYLTNNLLALSGEVTRRLSGMTTETSAVFNLTTQFGGGKTHALTLLYHLAKHGPAADGWLGVDRILDKANLKSLPQAAVAVFVGTEFDSLTGRGGTDGTPLRKTPWGEIAYQLGGEQALAIVAEHERQFIEPKGDVIRAFLPSDRPVLILMDEIINYASTYRSLGYHNRLYNFIQALSETARGRENVVLVVSLPASEMEYTTEDESDQQRFEKMLDRLGKAMIMSAETETSEIIRRRLFEWDLRALTADGRTSLPQEARETCQAYAEWVLAHRSQLPGNFPVDRAREIFEATYPFHPTVFSVFERKWQALPRFQRTRGVLRLLALWVARAYQDGYQGAHRDPLINMGTAPLDDTTFRSAVFEQLGERRLEAAVTSDICGKKDAHALRLDEEAIETIRKARLHRKTATAIFFESNGGQQRGEATTPEIRLAIGEPDLDIGNVETVLEALTGSNGCYYLVMEGNRYRFGVTENLNKLWADRRANIPQSRLRETIRAEIEKVFRAGSGIERVYFPEESNQISDRPVLTMAVIAPEHDLQNEAETTHLIEKITREAGNSNRTFKSALLWMVADSLAPLQDSARQLLAWETIQDEDGQGQLHLDETQKRQIGEVINKSRRDLREAVWRQYRHLFLLGKDNELRRINFGLLNSSASDTLVGLVLGRLRQDDEIIDSISPNFILRNWIANPEWSTRSLRDAFFASPRFPRLTNPDAIKDTISRGVSASLLGYVGKAEDGKYEPFCWNQALSAFDIEISDDTFIISGETAQRYQQKLDESRVAQPTGPLFAGDEQGSFNTGAGSSIETTQVAPTSESGTVTSPSPTPGANQTRLSWHGIIPPQKWMNFYMKVLSRFATGFDLQLNVKVEVAHPAGISEQKVNETRAALNELGLDDTVQTE